MGYTITSEYWLKSEADKVEGIILMAANWGTVWTAASLQLHLQNLGLIYTVGQCQEIISELVKRDVLEEPA